MVLDIPDRVLPFKINTLQIEEKPKKKGAIGNRSVFQEFRVDGHRYTVHNRQPNFSVLEESDLQSIQLTNHMFDLAQLVIDQDVIQTQNCHHSYL